MPNRAEIAAYAESVTTPMPEALKRLADETRGSLECPQMLTGPVEARFLQMLVFALGAERVLEIGTYSGYSALAISPSTTPCAAAASSIPETTRSRGSWPTSTPGWRRTRAGSRSC